MIAALSILDHSYASECVFKVQLTSCPFVPDAVAAGTFLVPCRGGFAIVFLGVRAGAVFKTVSCTVPRIGT